MYPSSNNINGCKPPWSSTTSFSDTNYSKIPQEHYYYAPSSSAFLLPSPNYVSLEDEPVFGEFFQQQFFSNDHNNYHNTVIPVQEMITNVESTMGECSNNGHVAMVDGDDEPYDLISTHVEPSSPRKRPNAKGDRHSKINTAQGPRDRRMRLSLDVAKKLFGLQDLLGFDKASKTVDWLLTKSKTAILELLPDQSCSFMGVSNSASSTSECEVLSGTGDQSMVKSGDGDDDQAITNNKAKSGGNSKKPKEKVTRVRSTDFHHPLAKATRARARARARERTNEKRNNKFGGDQDSKFRPCLDHVMDQNANQLGSWSPFTETQHQGVDQHDHINLQFQFKQGFVGDNSSLMMKTANFSPSYYFNYQHMQGLTHEQHFNDLQIIGKGWEDNTN